MKNLTPIEQNNQRVLLTSQLAKFYGTTDRRISENFNANKERYQEGKHFYCLNGQELKQFKNEYGNSVSVGERTPKLYLWTEHGALLHAKSLNTDKAWEVYGELVDTYFRVQEQKVKALSPIEMLRLQNQVLSELDTRMDTLEDKVENQITLDHGQQRTLQNIVSKRAYERVGQAFPFDIKENVGRFFKAIYKDLKNRFGVSSYRDILVGDYTNAIHYVKAWIEPVELREEV